MKKIAYILRLIFPKYRKFAFLHFAFILLSTLFGLFSFTMVMPFLSILFKTQEPVTTLVKWHANFESFKHNLYYYLSKLTENDPVDALMYVSALMVFFVLLKTGFLYLSRFFLVPIRNGIIKDIRNKIYRKILSLHIGYFSNERKGDIISRTTADVQEVESSIVGSLTIIFKDPVSIVMSVIILLSMSVKLTIVAFLVLPLSGLVIAAVGKSLRRKSLKAQNKLGELISIIEETLGGLRIIHAFNAQSKVNERFNAENDKYTKILNSVIRRRDLAVPVSEFLATTAIVILLVLGGTLIINGGIDMPPEDFFAFILIFSQVIQPVKDISGAWYSILKGFASVDRIDKILLAEPAIQDKPDAISVDGFHQSIRYKDVSFRYRNDYVLKKINFELQKGKTIALVGQSGSGKTTLVNLLPRFYELLEGSIEIDGADIRTLKINDLRGLMGIVNQES
ncbi:MAG: ABC transporter ATP-binding protein, partial [Bacteroidales bacterium]|nr:ABC transporter ATP-binding protein [Bacteroidales bacterium]